MGFTYNAQYVTSVGLPCLHEAAVALREAKGAGSRPKLMDWPGRGRAGMCSSRDARKLQATYATSLNPSSDAGGGRAR